MKTEYKKRRYNDIKTEKNIQEKMDVIYACIKKGDFSFEREFDAQNQKKGIDGYLSIFEKTYKVDEKSASRYAENQISTFAFELKSENNTNGDGWFNKENKIMETEKYMLIWPVGPIGCVKNNLKNITSLTAMLVDKKQIWNYLEQNGFNSVEEIKEYLDKNGKITQRGTKKAIVNRDIKIVQSLNIVPEKPLNVILSKYVLKNLCDISIEFDFISKNGKALFLNEFYKKEIVKNV